MLTMPPLWLLPLPLLVVVISERQHVDVETFEPDNDTLRASTYRRTNFMFPAPSPLLPLLPLPPPLALYICRRQLRRVFRRDSRGHRQRAATDQARSPPAVPPARPVLGFPDWSGTEKTVPYRLNRNNRSVSPGKVVPSHSHTVEVG